MRHIPVLDLVDQRVLIMTYEIRFLVVRRYSEMMFKVERVVELREKVAIHSILKLMVVSNNTIAACAKAGLMFCSGLLPLKNP